MERVSAIILCEGETDQVLLGSYLEKKKGWKYLKPLKDSPFPNEPIVFFHNPSGEVLGIWPVGGNDFKPAIKSVFEREINEHSINKLVIVTDHDEFEGTERFTASLNVINDEIETNINTDISLFQINCWNTIDFNNTFGDVCIDYLFLLIPLAETGALETFMLNTLSEQSVDKEHVIKEARRFVKEFHSEKYLKRRREKTKAELGVALSVFSPDKVFTTMKEIIDSVDWSSFETANKQFKLLEEI